MTDTVPAVPTPAVRSASTALGREADTRYLQTKPDRTGHTLDLALAG